MTSRAIARSAGLVLLAAGLLAVTSCRDSGSEGEYFAVQARIFEFNYRLARATYIVTLNPLQPMDGTQVIVGTFEDPAGGEPIVVRQKVWPRLTHVTLESPPLTCVIKDKPYTVTIDVEGGDGKVLQKLDTTVTSSLDQSILPDRPLVVGPVYELNKDLAEHPDGRLPDEPKQDCPAKA